MAKAERYRMRFDFHLNLAKSDENELVEVIAGLKSIGLFSKTIRDGIRLICDLREGNLDVLFELFPWVRAEFLEYMASVQPQKSDTEIHIQQQLSRIEELLANDETTTAVLKIGSRGGEPKSMSIQEVAAPVFGDTRDDLLIVSKAASSHNAARNFLDSAFKLVQ